MMQINRLQSVILGREEDGGVLEIEIDCSEWLNAYPGLTDYRIEATTPTGLVYIPVTTYRDGGLLIWPIEQSDTATTGRGSYQVVATGPNGKKKTSDSCDLIILPTLPGTAGEEIPEPSRGWVDEVVEAAKRAKEAAERAEDAAGNAGGGGGGSIDPEAIKDAVDAALEEAKASGDFKGDKGDKGDPGQPGASGSDASVTADNITAALGYTPADAAIEARIDGLAEENTALSKDTQALANVFATMTIEGYEAAEGLGYEDVKSEAEEHANEYFYKGWDSAASKGIPVVATLNKWCRYVLSVTEGEQYLIETRCGYANPAYCLLDADGYMLQCVPEPIPAANIVYEGKIVIPPNAVTMYINSLPSAKPLVIKRKGGIGGVLEFTRTEQSFASSDHLYGKKLACVGDSITEASNPDGGYFANYAELAAARHGMSVYKDGKGGSTMTNIESNIPPFSAERYLNVPSDYDILTIWFGWNDAAYATVGTIDDTDDTTYYGAYKKVLNYFITTYPTKKIGLIVPYGGASVEPFREAVRKLSEMYGVPCLDLADGKQCSQLWGTANEAQLARRAALTYDTTHPNQIGHEYLSTMYEEFIKRL